VGAGRRVQRPTGVLNGRRRRAACPPASMAFACFTHPAQTTPPTHSGSTVYSRDREFEIRQTHELPRPMIRCSKFCYFRHAMIQNI
jgi:hypothetical protein